LDNKDWASLADLRSLATGDTSEQSGYPRHIDEFITNSKGSKEVVL